MLVGLFYFMLLFLISRHNLKSKQFPFLSLAILQEKKKKVKKNKSEK